MFRQPYVSHSAATDAAVTLAVLVGAKQLSSAFPIITFSAIITP
jgi:hypothetical protein